MGVRRAVLSGFGLVAVIIMSTLFTRNPTRHGDPAPTLTPRAARAEDLARDAVAPVRLARVSSLWGDYAVSSCLVATVWAGNTTGASFLPTLRLSMKSPLRAPAAAARATTWIARDRLDLIAANDAEAGVREVSVEPGAEPVVRIFRARKFKANRTPFRLGSGLRLAA
ncbi:MAG: hypothetical protein IV086_03440 [Hyphomonadaceae bacterium]|nr:hypothetical protein [Hyphomonadaceae bacterium]